MGAITIAFAVGARSRPAAACTPSGPPSTGDAPDVVTRFRPLDDGTSTAGRPQAQNIALVFVADTGRPAREDLVRSRISVEVSRDGAAVAGEMRPTDGLGTSSSVWQWLPTGAAATPVGTYHVKVTNRDELTTSDGVRELDITVEDRAVVVPPLTLSLGLARDVVADPSAPTIGCSNALPVACAPAPILQTVPTRYRGLAGLTYTSGSFPRADYPYLASSARVFARTNGVVVEDHPIVESWDYSLNRPLPFDLEKADEYCVQVSAWLRTDRDHPQTEEQCRPNGDLDLSLSAEEQAHQLDAALVGCENPSYPPGVTAPGADAGSPGADAPNSSGSGGCAAAPAGASPFALGAIVSALALALQRRRRRRVTVGRPVRRR